MNHKLLGKDFALVVAGQIVSLFGNAILRFSLPLFLLRETGSSALFGMVTASSISHTPKLLILDEPLNGLDPLGIRQMRDLFLSLARERNMTLLISSHILSEVEQIPGTYLFCLCR